MSLGLSSSSLAGLFFNLHVFKLLCTVNIINNLNSQVYYAKSSPDDCYFTFDIEDLSGLKCGVEGEYRDYDDYDYLTPNIGLEFKSLPSITCKYLGN